MRKVGNPGVIFFFAAVAAAGMVPAHAGTPDTTDSSWFLTRTQALYDALVPGDKAIWRRTLSNDCIISDEDGHVYDKAGFLDTLSGLPKGFTGLIKIRHLTARVFGNAAVVHYWIDEHEDALGDKLHTIYVETDTYRQEGDTWRMLAAQSHGRTSGPEAGRGGRKWLARLGGQLPLGPRAWAPLSCLLAERIAVLGERH